MQLTGWRISPAYHRRWVVSGQGALEGKGHHGALRSLAYTVAPIRVFCDAHLPSTDTKERHSNFPRFF